MRRYFQRKLRAMFLWHFRDDIRLAYDRGYLTGLQDAGGPAFEDGYAEGFVGGMGFAANPDAPCAASPS